MAEWLANAECALYILEDCPPDKQQWLLGKLHELLLHTEAQRLVKRARVEMRKPTPADLTPVSPYVGRRVWAQALQGYIMTGEFVRILPGDGHHIFRVIGVASKEELPEGELERHYPEPWFVRAQWAAVVGEIDTIKDGLRVSTYPTGFCPKDKAPECDGVGELVLLNYETWFPASGIMGVAVDAGS